MWGLLVWLRRYLALCVGETRVRIDLLEPMRPRLPQSPRNDKEGGKLPLSPSTVHFLSQVPRLISTAHCSYPWQRTILQIHAFFTLLKLNLRRCQYKWQSVSHLKPPELRSVSFSSQLLSLHIDSINVMVLNLALSESLWHMTTTGITLLLDHQTKRWLGTMTATFSECGYTLQLKIIVMPMLFDIDSFHPSHRLAWEFSVGQLSSKVLKSSRLVSWESDTEMMDSAWSYMECLTFFADNMEFGVISFNCLSVCVYCVCLSVCTVTVCVYCNCLCVWIVTVCVCEL